MDTLQAVVLVVYQQELLVIHSFLLVQMVAEV
jgi:hypothetical protein